MKKIIIKIGTKLLSTANNQIDIDSLKNLVSQLAAAKKNHNIDLIVVTSGAIVFGSEELGIQATNIPEKQATAAIGQLALLSKYHEFFSLESIKIAQILLTQDITEDSEKQKNVINTIHTLLNHNVIPIINENDTVSTEDIKFGDNDILSSIVAVLLDVDLLVLLTDQDGLYDKNPTNYSDAKLITLLHNVDDNMIEQADAALDAKGRGGIKSKLLAAKRLLTHNKKLIIANGRQKNVILDIINGLPTGTLFTPK
jgi:glutamate 5-kinase